MKDEILSVLTMNDILSKYGIQTRRDMFSCPFHGQDKTPSAKAYKTSYYCFACNKTSDLIGFVQDYFHLGFREAMQKINQDFNLGLDCNAKVDYAKIKFIEEQRKKKQQEKEKLTKEYVELCKQKSKISDTMDFFDKMTNKSNWETNVFYISQLQDKIGIIDTKLDIIDQKLSSRN